MVNILLLICAVSLYGVTSASAVGAETTIGAAIGESEADLETSGADRVNDTDTSFKIFIGRDAPNFAVEFGYIDLGEVSAHFPLFDETDRFEATALFATLMRKFQVSERVSLFAKGGLAFWDAEASAQGVVVGVPVSGSGSETGLDLLIGIGAEIKASDRLGIRLEFEQYQDVADGVEIPIAGLGVVELDGVDVDVLSVSFVYSLQKPSPRVRTTPESKPAEIETPMPKAAPTPSMAEKPKPALPEATAAARGDADAQYRLGYMYGTGQGVPKDDGKAVGWYRKAAGQGHARAQYNLGVAYANGTGVIRNKETAAEWFFEAGQSFVREGKRALALRVVDTIERLIPGHVLASELLAAIRARFGF